MEDINKLVAVLTLISLIMIAAVVIWLTIKVEYLQKDNIFLLQSQKSSNELLIDLAKKEVQK